MNDPSYLNIERKLVDYGYDVHNWEDPDGYDEPSLVNLHTGKEVMNWKTLPKNIEKLAKALITGNVPPYDEKHYI